MKSEEYLVRAEKALRLHEQGVSAVNIAERFGVKRPAVNRMIVDARLERRRAATTTEPVA